MKTEIKSKKFNSFTSHTLCVDGVETNFWNTDYNIVSAFKKVFDEDLVLKEIFNNCKSKNYFSICEFIPSNFLADLPIEIKEFYTASNYWNWFDSFGKNGAIEIFSISGKPVQKEQITIEFVRKEVSLRSLTQLLHLYNKDGRKAKKLIACVFDFGITYVTIF